MGHGRIKRQLLSAGSFVKGLKQRVKERKKAIKTAAVIITILTAVLAFWWNGEEQPVEMIGGDSSAYAITGDTASKAAKQDEVMDKELPAVLFCDIGGAVNEPGVYSLPEGSRLCDLIDLAGGLRDDADISSVNRALILSDGAMIRIPVRGEETVSQEASNWYSAAEDTSGTRLININTSGPEELQLIPGVGPAIAGRIIEYRESNGPFQTIEEIRSVKGIGEKTYEKIKDHICC